MKCKVCSKDLYKNITFENILNINYEKHKECDAYLDIEPFESVIPIDGNQIIFSYCYEEKKKGYDYDYVEFFTIGRCIHSQLKSSDWSMMYYYEEKAFLMIDNIAIYLLYKLADKNIVFISMFPY